MTVCTPDLKEERRLRAQGYESVAGLDEVGRGAWAGPVTVGVAVVRPRVTRRSMPPWLRDSKMLSEARREEIFEAVGTWCQSWAVGHASAAECDEWGMTEALRVAARRALAGLGQPPEALLVDGPVNLLRHPDDPFTGEVRPIVDGDAKCASVAAASVLAKVIRDRLMRAGGGPLPRLRLRTEQGVPLAGPPDRAARVRSLGDPPAQLGLRPRPAVVRAVVERDTIRRPRSPRRNGRRRGDPAPGRRAPAPRWRRSPGPSSSGCGSGSRRAVTAG